MQGCHARHAAILAAPGGRASSTVTLEEMDALAAFTPATRSWFERAFAGPTPAQEAAWPAIATGSHVLVQAPTGSGKTLAAFLTGIDRLNARSGEGLRLLYVSPLKALNYDV